MPEYFKKPSYFGQASALPDPKPETPEAWGFLGFRVPLNP